MSSVEPAFTQNLKQVMVPILTELGFQFNDRRVFRRLVDNKYVQIIDVQLGQRFMQGKFTINLAVFDPENCYEQIDFMSVREYHCVWQLRQRLGLLIPPKFPRLEKIPLIGFLWGPRDIWWSAKDIEGLNEAKKALLSYGLPWIKDHTPE